MGRISVSRPHQSLFCSQDWEIKATIKQNNEEEIVQNDVSQALARHHPPNCTFLKVYMEFSSYFLFLQEQIKDIIINKQLRMHVKQSLDDIRNGTIGVDEARKQVLANRIAAAKEVIQAIPEDKQAHMPFRNKEQQLLLKRKSKLAAELREALSKKGLTQNQQMCMYYLGLTVPLLMSKQGKEAMVDTVQWKTLLKAEIQNCTNKIDNMAKHQTHKCELQAKRQEARTT